MLQNFFYLQIYGFNEFTNYDDYIRIRNNS
jgi:hypothetical protein